MLMEASSRPKQHGSGSVSAPTGSALAFVQDPLPVHLAFACTECMSQMRTSPFVSDRRLSASCGCGTRTSVGEGAQLCSEPPAAQTHQRGCLPVPRQLRMIRTRDAVSYDRKPEAARSSPAETPPANAQTPPLSLHGEGGGEGIFILSLWRPDQRRNSRKSVSKILREKRDFFSSSERVYTSVLNLITSIPWLTAMRMPSNLPRPTRELGEHGLDLWTAVQSDYLIEDSAGIEVLMEACAALDRANPSRRKSRRTGRPFQAPRARGSIPVSPGRTEVGLLLSAALRASGYCTNQSSRSAAPADRIARRNPRMTTNRTPIARERRGRITADQEQALWLGPLSKAFEREKECRAAWGRHRASLLHMFSNHGRRPAAWWQFDAPEGLVYDFDRERSMLFEAGLLSKPERDALVEYWRSEFDRCHQPGFTLCIGPSGSGREARAAHLAWADIPASLVKRWNAERRSV